MFNSTHTLVALALARSGMDRWVPYAATTAVIASNLPDLEIVTGLAGTPTYIDYHRGITHTFIGVPILSLALALAIYIFSGTFWKTFVVALLVMGTHPTLDYANTYGVRPFLPFDVTWYYGDTLFVIDPYLDFIFLAGIVVGHRFKHFRGSAALISIFLAIAYIGGRIELRNLAHARLETFTSTVPGVQRLAVFPRMIDPRIWDGIVETGDELMKVRVHAFYGVDRELARIPKGASSEIIGHAVTAPSASVFREFARFPVTRVEETEFGYRVVLLDFRFYDETRNRALAAEVLLDHSLNVIKDGLSFNRTIGE